MNDALERVRLAYERRGRGCIVSLRRGEPRYATMTELAGRLGPEDDMLMLLTAISDRGRALQPGERGGRQDREGEGLRGVHRLGDGVPRLRAGSSTIRAKISAPPQFCLRAPMNLIIVTLRNPSLNPRSLGEIAMGTATPVHSVTPRTSPSPWLTVGVGTVCLALGLVAGRVTAPKPIAIPSSTTTTARSKGSIGPPMDTLTTQTSASDLSSADQQLKAYCSAKWGTNFAMVAYCQQQQREAVEKLQRLGPNDVPADVFSTIRANCATKWPDDFTMRDYCEGEQVKGYRASR